MELPFAVGVDQEQAVAGSSLQNSDSSLVTASSQGSFIDSRGAIDSAPLPPNTPQDVVLPRYDMLSTQDQTGSGGHLLTPAQRQMPDDGLVETEVIDFTYVNISETDADDVDVLLEEGNLDLQDESNHGDILTVLLSGIHHPHSNEALLAQTEKANDAAWKASEAKKKGDLIVALECHTRAAKFYRDTAIAVRERNVSLANSMLLLSQTQAKSALALKGIVKLNPAELCRIMPPSSNSASDRTSTAEMSHKERLRAAVRGALGSRHPHEADISESQFLGTANSEPTTTKETKVEDSRNDNERGTLLAEGKESEHNPVDEMMELERELRDMDMALELGNSISSLDTRMQNRMKNSVIDGSFMVVPPGSNSYMASSAMWGSGHITTNARSGPQPIRARANRVQNMLEASAAPANRPSNLPQMAPPANPKTNPGLESSWWGGAGTASQVLSSSVISLGSRAGTDGHPCDHHGSQPANTKQLMRLMDSLKTLGDENAVLLREVEDAEAARQEAKQAREQMKRFKAEYGKRFGTLKKALEKFRQEHPQGKGGGSDPVNNSEFMQTASVSDQLQRQEQLIRKLTADLKKEKEESKKKDAALRKYESFYREVKARSAQKAAMKTQQQRQHKSPRLPSSATKVHR